MIKQNIMGDSILKRTFALFINFSRIRHLMFFGAGRNDWSCKAEILSTEPAPQSIREFFARYEAVAEIVTITPEMYVLRQQYINSGIVTPKSAEDALHVAIATVTQCSLIVSRNFRHIVHFDKIPKYNAVNTLNGYGQIGIYSPLEVINYGSDDS